jgi:DNA-binding GntR family transcriptional regulator
MATRRGDDVDEEVVASPLGNRHRTLESMVCEQLRTWIVTGRLKPGSRLVESTLADEMGVSRGPVRNAIRQLVREGFVDLAPRRGATVAEVSVRDALHCYEVRIALEGTAARLAAARRTDADLASLDAVLAAGDQAVVGGRWDALAPLNNDFHTALATAADNAELVALMQQYSLRIAWIFSLVAERRGVPAWAEHAGIIEAVRAGRAEVAESLARRHIERSREQFLVEAERSEVGRSRRPRALPG